MFGHSLITNKYHSMLTGGSIIGIVTALMIMSDAVIAGIMIGENAVAGINLITPVYSFGGFFAFLFSVSIPVLYNQAMGKFNQDKAQRLFGFGLAASIGIGLLMLILLLLFQDAYLAHYGVSNVVVGNASRYLLCMQFVILLLPVNNLLRQMMFADGDEKRGTAASIAGAACNLIVSIVACKFIGILGIGAGTLAGAVISMAVCLPHFLGEKNTVKLKLAFDKSFFKLVFLHASVDSSTFLFLALFGEVLNKFTAAEFGSASIVMVAVITMVREFQIFFEGIGIAISPIVSVYLSEKCYAAVRRVWSMASRSTLIQGAIALAAWLVISPFMPRVLGIEDPTMAAQASEGFRIMAAGMIFTGYLYLNTSYYLLLDKIPLSLFICALRDIVFSLPLAIIMGNHFGVYGIYLGVLIGSVLGWVVAITYIRVRYGRDDFPHLLKDREKDITSWLLDFQLEPESIVESRDELEKKLLGEGYTPQSIYQVMLIFEELFMMIYEKNPQGKVQAECAVIIRDDKIRLIARDNGIPLDLANMGMDLGSLRAYTLSQLGTAERNNARYLMTMSFNRNVMETSIQRGE